MLILKDIKKKYVVGETEQQVLKGINIHFRRNEFISVLGASGSGKTTLLNIIGGLDAYDSGDLIIENVSTSNYKDKDWDSYRNYRVGFIFQSYNLISHQTLFTNVELALTLSGISKKDRKKKVIEALEKVGLKDHIYKKSNQLSGGQMQRVAIARALINDPEIILADEPTGSLDSETSIQIMDLLKEISKDKLVIMVTHNPELAKHYSTRIIGLKDGIIMKDSNPYNNEPEAKEGSKLKRTSMSLLTALSLSYNNLLTKKGRTFLTAIAGSVGITGIALILAMSNGVTQYVANLEKESMSDYPITVEKTSMDITNIFSAPTEEKTKCKGQLCSYDDITPKMDKLANDVIKKNNLVEFKKFIEKDKEVKDLSSEITYGYDVDLNLYSFKEDNYVRVNPPALDITEKLKVDSPEEKVQIESDFSFMDEEVFTELSADDKIIKNKYELVAGKLPSNYNEMVLIVNKDGTLPDSMLYALNIKDQKELIDKMNKIINKEKVKKENEKISYEDILKITYKLVLNTDYYRYENGEYKDYSQDRKFIKDLVQNGETIKIVGVLKGDEDKVSVNLIGYSPSLIDYVMKQVSKTDIYKDQTSNKEYDVLTGEKFDGVVSSYESNCKTLGIANEKDPSKINIYPKDFESKEKIVSLIEKYNTKQKNNNRGDLVVSYTDLIKTVVGGVTKVIKYISIVLICFVAISLIVSSIMIAIITYISVLERTKEIGILRAIGASKRDVARVFKSETIIEGFIAGLLGVGFTWILCALINFILSFTSKFENLLSLPLSYGLLLILLSIVITVCAGYIPSNKASKKNPVEALRSE